MQNLVGLLCLSFFFNWGNSQITQYWFDDFYSTSNTFSKDIRKAAVNKLTVYIETPVNSNKDSITYLDKVLEFDKKGRLNSCLYYDSNIKENMLMYKYKNNQLDSTVNYIFHQSTKTDTIVEVFNNSGDFNYIKQVNGKIIQKYRIDTVLSIGSSFTKDSIFYRFFDSNNVIVDDVLVYVRFQSKDFKLTQKVSAINNYSYQNDNVTFKSEKGKQSFIEDLSKNKSRRTDIIFNREGGIQFAGVIDYFYKGKRLKKIMDEYGTTLNFTYNKNKLLESVKMLDYKGGLIERYIYKFE